MITYGTLGCIYPDKYYYVLSNKKEHICYIPVEEKQKRNNEHLINKLGFDLRLGKEFM